MALARLVGALLSDVVYSYSTSNFHGGGVGVGFAAVCAVAGGIEIIGIAQLEGTERLRKRFANNWAERWGEEKGKGAAVRDANGGGSEEVTGKGMMEIEIAGSGTTV